VSNRIRVDDSPVGGSIRIYDPVTTFGLLRYSGSAPSLRSLPNLQVLATRGSPCPQRTRAGEPGSRLQRADRVAVPERVDSISS